MGTNTLKSNSNKYLNINGIVTILLILVFLGVNLVTLNGAIDEMGPQWYYLSMANIVVAIYLFFQNKSYQEAIKTVLSSSFSILFIVFILYIGASYFYAINKTEMLVCYARFMTMAMMFFNIAILLQKDANLLRIIVILLCLALFADSYYTISTFLNRPPEVTNYDSFILSIKGNASNKNIFAASMAIKIPFCMYFVYELNTKWKYLFMSILMMAVMSIVIMSTRSTYVSLAIYTILFIILCIIETKRKQINFLKVFKLLIPIVIGVIFAFLAINTVITEFEKNNQGILGTLNQRVSSINLEGSGRKDYWLASIDYLKNHKLIGAGFGNWKIAVIPYESEILNDNILSYHVHNDFLEIGAETGIMGLLLYLSLFILTFILFLKNYFNKTLNQNRFLHFFSMLALVGYGVDASLNFPIERPITQILFAFVCSINLIIYLQNKVAIQNTQTKKVNPYFLSEITTIAIILIMLPVAYITKSTFESMQLQPKVYADLDPKKMNIDSVRNLNTFFPNLTATGLSVSDIIGSYYVKNGNYLESIPYFDQGKIANPYFHLSDTYKSLAYINLNKDDSALKYAIIAFKERPRSKTAYNQIINVASKLKDTVLLKKAFLTYTKYRNDDFGWYLYLNNLIRIKQSFTTEINNLLDSSVKLFPENKDLKNLQDISKNGTQLIVQQNNNTAVVNNNINQALIEKKKNIDLLVIQATNLFNAQKYIESAKFFLKASELDPQNYAYYENAGVCFYNNNKFEASLPYFDKSINLKTSNTGKSEFFKGIALNTIGKKADACILLQISKDKKYPDADRYYTLLCKEQIKK